MTTELTPAQARYHAAMTDADACLAQLVADGREERAAGLAVGVDLGVSAAFLFSLSDQAYEDATNVVRAAIAHATREDDAR